MSVIEKRKGPNFELLELTRDKKSNFEKVLNDEKERYTHLDESSLIINSQLLVTKDNNTKNNYPGIISKNGKKSARQPSRPNLNEQPISGKGTNVERTAGNKVEKATLADKESSTSNKHQLGVLDKVIKTNKITPANIATTKTVNKRGEKSEIVTKEVLKSRIPQQQSYVLGQESKGCLDDFGVYKQNGFKTDKANVIINKCAIANPLSCEYQIKAIMSGTQINQICNVTASYFNYPNINTYKVFYKKSYYLFVFEDQSIKSFLREDDDSY